MKKVIIILLMIFISNSCIPYIVNEMRKEDWKEGWWWNQKDYSKGKKRIKVCDTNRICTIRYIRENTE